MNQKLENEKRNGKSVTFQNDFGSAPLGDQDEEEEENKNSIQDLVREGDLIEK